MLKYYVRRSVSEDFQSIATPPKENAWIHGNLVTLHELEALAKGYGLDFNILRDVLDKNELPRVEIRGEELYVFARSAERTKRGQILTTPVLLAVKSSVFMNLSAGPIDNHLLTTPHTTGDQVDATRLLLGSFAAVVGEYEVLMQRSARYIGDTTNRLHTHEVTNEDFIKFVTVEDTLNECRMNLNGMFVITERIKEALKADQDREAVEDIMLHLRQLLVAIDSYNQNITSIRNAYSTIANNVLNQRMKTLTALTVLIALPNVFYGMYGMNVPLPYQTLPWAYAIIVGFSVAVMITVIVIARRKGIF